MSRTAGTSRRTSQHHRRNRTIVAVGAVVLRRRAGRRLVASRADGGDPTVAVSPTPSPSTPTSPSPAGSSSTSPSPSETSSSVAPAALEDGEHFVAATRRAHGGRDPASAFDEAIFYTGDEAFEYAQENDIELRERLLIIENASRRWRRCRSPPTRSSPTSRRAPAASSSRDSVDALAASVNGDRDDRLPRPRDDLVVGDRRGRRRSPPSSSSTCRERARLGRRLLRPAADPDDRLGRGRPRAAAAGGRRAGARRRVRHRQGDRGAARRGSRVARSSRSTARPRWSRRPANGSVTEPDRRTWSTTCVSRSPIEPVDAVLSTATFHWITDHERLFANLAAAMRPGAPLVAQCGGAGNLARVVAASAALGHDLLATKRYAGPEETARPAAGRRVHRRPLLAPGRADAAASRRPRGVPRDRDPRRRDRGLPADDAAAFVHGVAVVARCAGARLRPAQHRRPSRGLDEQRDRGVAHLGDRGGGADRLLEPVEQVLAP